MNIDDIPAGSVLTVGLWRSVLHDVVDEVLDRILLTAEAEWEREIDVDDEWPWEEDDEPPGDPPAGDGPVPTLAAALGAGLASAIERGTGFWGCDGTLRCTRAWAEEVLDGPDVVLDSHRRKGRFCDCAVLHHARGRTGPAPPCPGDPGRGPGYRPTPGAPGP